MADQSEAPKRRLVKNPETFRERAVKAAEASEKPNRQHRFREAGSKIVSPVTKPIGSTARTVFARQPFRFIGKALGFISQFIFPRYFRQSWQELRLVKWPNWRESRRLTTAVLIFAIVFGAIIALVDYGLDKLFKQLLVK